MTMMMAYSSEDPLPSELLRARDLVALRSKDHLTGEYLSCCLSDQATVEWTEEHFPDMPLNYHRMIIVNYRSAPIPFLEWLQTERNADLWELERRCDAIDSALVGQAPLEKLEWIRLQGAIMANVPGWMTGECCFARAAMYKVSMDNTLSILEWLHDQGGRPRREACNFAIAYSPWPREVVCWLRNHGACLSSQAFAQVVRRPCQVRSSAAECIELMQWLLDCGLEFDEETCIKIGDLGYYPQMLELFPWVIAHGAPWSEAAAYEFTRGSSPERFLLAQVARNLGLPLS
jgi:hypothetical protein